MVLFRHLKPEVIQVVRGLIIEDVKLSDYVKTYKSEIGRSLELKTADEAAIRSFVTYVNKLPTGKEKGNFLALDFGGPTIKIILLTLTNGNCKIKAESFNIPPRYMTGKSTKLLDYVANCVSKFVEQLRLKMLRIPLGITFGFPTEQISLQDCKLVRWTKGFQCKDLVGENVFSKLKDSFRKFPVLRRVYIIGILNESVSLLLASTIHDPNCKIGMVIGHVTNSCYAEKVSSISKYQAKTFGEKYMYMNLDSSNFGEDGCVDHLRTEFDRQMDEESSSPGKLINEKMTSITYLGEIARLALVKCIKENLILGGKLTPAMDAKDSFQYTHMMQIESDPENEHSGCRSVLREFGYEEVGDSDCIQIQFICRCVSRRAANLVAAQLAALMNRINEPAVGIALEGEMIRKYPNFEWYMTRKLNQLKKEEVSILKLGDNDLSSGAAVMASVFGEEVMDRDEKLRRLPGFPVNKCHFRRTGRCLNPNCNAKRPCSTKGENNLNTPMKTEIRDLSPPCFDQSKCPTKKQKNLCIGYDQL